MADNGVRVGKRGVTLATPGQAPREEIDEVSDSVRPADPPVTNPLR